MNSMNYLAAAPEILLLGAALIIAMVDLWVTDSQRRPTYLLTQLTLLAYAGWHLLRFEAGGNEVALQGMFAADALTHLVAAVSALAVAAVLLLSRPYAQAREMLKGELFTLSLFMLLGVAIMSGAKHFLAAYLPIFTMSVVVS